MSCRSALSLTGTLLVWLPLERDPEEVEALWRLFSHNRAGLLRHVSLESFITVGTRLWYGTSCVFTGNVGCSGTR